MWLCSVEVLVPVDVVVLGGGGAHWKWWCSVDKVVLGG